MTKQLTRKVAIVTGASSGIGTAIAKGSTDIAKVIVYAVTQPDHVHVNEITVRPV